MENRFVGIALLLILLVGCNKKEENKEFEKVQFELTDSMMNRIKMDTVLLANVQNILNLNGNIAADENRLVEIFPVVGGNVTQVNVDLGDYVEKGKVLAVIKSGEVAEYERQLIDAQSEMMLARKNLKVQQELFESKLVSEREVISAKNEFQKAEADLRRIEQLFKIYNINSKSEYIVLAPISGFVIERNINRDMTLRSDRSDNIFTIARIDEVWMNANVYESDISKISLGMFASITPLSYPEMELIGKVDKVFNVLDPITKTMRIRVKLDNKLQILKPGMVANVVLNWDEKEIMPSILASALVFDNNKNYVMVFHSKNNIETREVEIYKTTRNRAYIKSGLSDGEIVISANALYIYDALND